jgi:FlaA1/EpsC-like NDP-sugar epimerase
VKFLSAILHKRFCLILLFKVALISVSFLLAFLLCFDLHTVQADWALFERLIVPVLLIKLVVFWAMGLNHGWWRYVSISDVFNLFLANLTASSIAFFYVAIGPGLAGVPRSLFLLDVMICFLIGCGIRIITRAWRENYFPMGSAPNDCGKRVLIVGAGSAGQMIVKEMRVNPALKISVVGFIDDDPTKLNQHFQGFPVLGYRTDLAEMCRKYDIEEVIIAIPSATGSQLRRIVDSCRSARVTFKTLPGVGELIDGRVTVQQIKDVDLEDLLGREPVTLDEAGISSYLKGKRILVTGAAGSIGSEICRQIAPFQPERLILFDKAETPMFFLERELRQRFPDLPLTPVMGDIRHRTHTTSVLDEHRPEVVFHAAAYKHVPMMEANPEAAANNNVRGTKILADAAHSFGVQRFVMISTDKAVNPTNVMGASKRAAELYVQSLAGFSKTRFVTVRFGNVLGSNGSVIPIFREQIEKGGPVTVTDPEVIRYFMTIPEASQLVLQAGSMGKGGEIFLLDMGEPIKIVTLAEEMIRLSGFRPYEDIDIVFTGLRPGEKLFEELLLAGEGIQPTAHKKIMVARAEKHDWKFLNQKIDDLYNATQMLEPRQVLKTLREIVPEFRGRGIRTERLIQASAGKTRAGGGVPGASRALLLGEKGFRLIQRREHTTTGADSSTSPSVDP